MEAILDSSRIESDAAYREELRHRFFADTFFAAELMGFTQFNRKLHQPAVDLQIPWNPKVEIEEQDPIKFRMHLDPRKTFKTTLGLVNTEQALAAHSARLTMLYETATQPLASSMMNVTIKYFERGWLRQLFPECEFVKRTKEDCYDSKLRMEPSIDPTVGYTSPNSAQAGWHPYLMNVDDVVDAVNSGIGASDESRNKLKSTHQTNKNLLRAGGFMNIRGTRYHRFDLYGGELETMNPAKWKVLIRGSLTMKNGERLVPGEFPEADQMVLNFGELREMDYESLRDLFYADYETFMCFRAGCMVLMADWTEKPIEQVRVGDEVVGFEKHGRYRAQLKKARVEKVFSRRAEVSRVTTDGGRVTYPTFDHRFLRPPNGGELKYAPLKLGSKMVSVYTPSLKWPMLHRDMDWLGGILDGEGAVSKEGVGISQKKSVNEEVFSVVLAVLRKLEIDFSLGVTHSTDRIALLGGRSLLIRLLQQARMAKVTRFYETLWGAKQIAETSGRGGGSTYPVVQKMESIGEETVFDIQTTTHNFVCDGFAVHNCQQMNDPMGGAVVTFTEPMWAAAQIDPDKIPPVGETVLYWRPAYGGKPCMASYDEGAMVRVVNGKLFVLDAWKGVYAPTSRAEKIVQAIKDHEADAVVIEAAPGTEYIGADLRNEGLRRNRGVRVQWMTFEEDDHVRLGRMKKAEPLMKAGMLLFNTRMKHAADCHKQFVNFGLLQENGIVDCVSRATDLVPSSLWRANMTEEELEYQRRRREDAQWTQIFGQMGMNEVRRDEEQKALATVMALEAVKTAAGGVSPLPGGLDG